MRFSVSLRAEGDRIVELEEVVRLADVVAVHQGIASGVGQMSYGAQIVVEDINQNEAVRKAVELFTTSAQLAELPIWPVTDIEVVAEDDGMDDIP